ncbi:MAG: heat shock protein HtpX [Crocinitomicaceae bacterium]|jgi:heat shock protein HtpX
MKYIGLQNQINRNNTKSILVLLAFPLVILLGIYAFFFFTYMPYYDEVNTNFLMTVPFVIGGVGLWFLIAFKFHGSLIKLSTKSTTLSRKENMRVYNLTENLCISVGMTMPKLHVIQSPALNAFASGLNEKTFSVTLTTGIIETLSDIELEGVIAHELSHIRNKDVRLLIISIIFVGILGFLVSMLFRSLFYGRAGRSKDSKIDGRAILIALAIGLVVYFLTILFKFALSRKREYLADASAVEITKNPMAMASALRKISGNHELDVKSDDVKQMFIENGKPKKQNVLSKFMSLFATHPPIEKRIAVLEQM